ncbi:MAG: MBL fold metallo-hydrolase [Myxococcota bacterium]
MRRLLLKFFLLGFVGCSSATPVPPHASGRASAERTSPTSPESQHGISLTYLGVAGWHVLAGEYSLLLDPYFTRKDPATPEQPLSPDPDAITRFTPPRAEFILVGHSHYDHLLDVPTIAERTRASVVGTESTLNIARAAGISEARLVHAVPNQPLALAPFAVRPLASLHSLIGIDSFDIPRNVQLPLRAKDYGEGGTLAYLVDVNRLSMLFIDTANYIDSALQGLRPNVLIVAIGLREKVPDYTCRLMKILGEPPLVLPNHFDAHWKPVSDRQTPIDPEQLAQAETFATEVRACSPKSKVVIPQRFQPIPL